MESSNAAAQAKPGKTAAKKTMAKSEGKSKAPAQPRRAVSRKTGASRKQSGAAGTTEAPAKSAQTASGISDEQIRTRAYFLAEWRLKHGVAGDSDQDWIEARRQLQEEAKQK